MKRTRVKIVAVHENPNTPCWPCIDHDHTKELNRILQVVYAKNPQMDFDLTEVTELSQVQQTYEEDVKTYDGVLVLLMTCWKNVDTFYAMQSAKGLPTVIADVPYCGSGSTLIRASELIRKEHLQAVLLSTLDYTQIADAVRLFDVIAKMKQTRILDITGRPERNRNDYEKFHRDWGCTFVQKSGEDLMEQILRVSDQDAADVAARWKAAADEVVEPSEQDLLDAAKMHLALKEMMRQTETDAVTLDCLNISYGDGYRGKKMYPCLSHYEMLCHGTVAVCESDLNATVTSLVIRYLTDKPGFVSDPVIDTSSDQIIYAHCVACPKVYGFDDPRTCRFSIRSHAEDKKGASVQVYFPANEKVTTLIIYPTESAPSVIHSGRSVGNVGFQEACRSKLAAETNAEAILNNWSGGWHRVTVFGDYRKTLRRLFRMKGISYIEEDKD